MLSREIRRGCSSSTRSRTRLILLMRRYHLLFPIWKPAGPSRNVFLNRSPGRQLLKRRRERSPALSRKQFQGHAEPAPAGAEQSGDFIEMAGSPQAPSGRPVEAQAGARQTAGEADKGPSEQASQTSDDFTTNTLAELYIAQGFYEKAIDIYDRMLAENPASLPLQDKLARVRALAGPAAPANDLKTDRTPFVQPGVSSLSSQGQEPSSPFREKEVSKGVPLSPDAGFKTGEYQAPGQASKSGEEARSRPVAAGKKETIDRLEQWLKNIMKEKQN